MRPTRRAVAATLLPLATALLAGCGIRPTGVLDGGDAPSGLTKGMRLYFVSQTGRLEAVSRPDMPAYTVTEPASIIKLLGAGPNESERASGLATLLYGGNYEATVKGKSVTVRATDEYLDATDVGDRNLAGQLVCSIARAQAVGDTTGTTRTDDIRVTVSSLNGRMGSFVCSDFLK
ncbi:hypothetical protein AAHZ94_19720 [Streptomyces sp. HSW2009]|uniref:hypothetical protein n=1 Tax=Streptomyces sp. HSW2009 TaxID=3142890 RepID=UPI0032EAC3F5